MTMDAVELDPAKTTSLEPPAPGIRIGGIEATSRNKEHLFYAATKNGGTLLAIIWLFTQPTGLIEWSAFAVFYVMNILSMSLGYHRYFTHRAFETSTPMRYGLAIQDFGERFAALIDEFRTSFGYVYDGSTVRRTMSLFEVLQEKAVISYVRRDRFSELAVHRKRTKTPPGFKDDLDGDFFVWLDMLDSLLIAQSRQIPFHKVVLVSNDKKLDWSREGIAHPILSAELMTLIGVPFETWDVFKLVRNVAAESE